MILRVLTGFLLAVIHLSAPAAAQIPQKIQSLAALDWIVVESDTAGWYESLVGSDGAGEADRARRGEDSTLCFVAILDGDVYVHFGQSEIWRFRPSLEALRALPQRAYDDLDGCVAAIRSARQE